MALGKKQKKWSYFYIDIQECQQGRPKKIVRRVVSNV